MKRRLMAMGLLLTWALAWGSSALAGEGAEVEVPDRLLGQLSPARRHPVPLGRGRLRCAHGGMV